MIGFLILILFSAPALGGFAALQTSRYNEKKLRLFLSFAGGYLFSLTLLSLMPEVYKSFSPFSGVLVLSGFMFQVFLERFSAGIEHGHLHHHQFGNKVMPVTIMLSMCLHTFMEGVPLGAMMNSDTNVRFSLLAGIVLHEFPAAFALTTILKGLKLGKTALLFAVLVYALSSPLGAILSNYLNYSLPQNVFNYFMAFVVGTFLHISTTILFESSEHHHFSRLKLYAVIAGLALALAASLI